MVAAATLFARREPLIKLSRPRKRAPVSGVEVCDHHVFSDSNASRWTQKGIDRASELLPLAGLTARPGQVWHEKVAEPHQWPLGRFMGAWLADDGTSKTLKHLPDAAFFMRLLAMAYSPVMEGRPDRANLLSGQSRLEMSLTNDALQIQLVTIDPGYSMVRHHALMLFEAALWLDEPNRSAWLGLYDDLVTAAEDRPGGLPTIDELDSLEATAFADMVRLAPQTFKDAPAKALLAEPALLSTVLDYQFYAGVAIGLLWREYRDLELDRREAWQIDNLSQGYITADYLAATWMEH